MRAFSVLFIFATLAVIGGYAYGVIENCRIECSSDSTRVCNKIGNRFLTTTKCESTNLIRCAALEEKKNITLEAEKPCPKHTYYNCEIFNTDKDPKPVCGRSNGEYIDFISLSAYLDRYNCLEADGYTGPSLVSYGFCPKNQS